MSDSEKIFEYLRVKNNFNEIVENSPNKIIQKLVEAGDEWMHGRDQDGDISFVVICIK